MSESHSSIEDYKREVFSARTSDGHKITHDVYARGEGPPVVLVQELPGIGKESLRLADRLVEAGYEVVIPHLFGPIGRTAMGSNLLRVMCLRREFRLFAKRKSSPIVDWLRALCDDLRKSRGVAGVGVIGMCLTGNFAITLIGDDSVLAAVASQPAMPFNKQNALHLSDEEIAASRSALELKGPMLALRFEDDKMCSQEKFDCIRDNFNDDGEERIKLRTLQGDGHSVLTLDFVDEEGHPTREALKEVMDYFHRSLREGAGTA